MKNLIIILTIGIMNNCSGIVAELSGGETLANYKARIQKIEAEGNAVARKIQAQGEGEAIMLQAENEKRSLVAKAEAEAELEASKLQAESIKIMGEMAKKYPEYRHQMFISDFGEALK